MLVVEDGTGVAAANSYATVAFADAFHADRNNFNWAGDTATKEAALIRATDYLVQIYRERWQGSRVQYYQALDWPRIGVVLRDVNAFINDVGFYGNVQANIVPVQVQQATALLALKAIAFNDDGSQADLAPDIGRVTKSEKVGSLAVEYEAGSVPFVQYRAIDHLLSAFLSSGTIGVRIERA